MSRAANKSRADKARGGPTNPTPVPPPALNQDVVDIIPGRLPQSFWTAMITQEEGEDVVREIMEDLMGNVMEKCKREYLNRQLIPYTVARTRDTLLEILEWRFLVQDPGEPSGNTWKEDREPQPLLTDSWAQGCVAVSQRKPTPPPQPRAAPTEKLMRRRNTEYHQKTWGAAKHLKDQRECPESKSAPARRSEKKRLSLSSMVPADVSQRSNPQLVGRIVPPDQSGGSPQQARKLFNTPTFTSMAPHIEELCLREGRRSLEHLSITSAL
ncbi:uncharacterized protein C2orf81 homolog [Engraulis encrasicolus]|uniref:uncharacterized protein C2orf81 homolog n=1 Tax=Engraulis encrasicolus TaxID=184585 RepID=UPI002FD173FC